MSKVNFKQKQKKLREQRVRQTGWSEGTWDCSFSDSNEVLQSDEAESPKGVSQAVFDERPKAREKIKKKLEAARHKPDPSVPAEKLSDYTYIAESIVIWTHGISLHSILHFMMR